MWDVPRQNYISNNGSGAAPTAFGAAASAYIGANADKLSKGNSLAATQPKVSFPLPAKFRRMSSDRSSYSGQISDPDEGSADTEDSSEETEPNTSGRKRTLSTTVM